MSGDFSELRGAVAYLPQTTQVYHGTIAQNLRLTNPVATDADLMDAARRANLWHEIAALAAGLERGRDAVECFKKLFLRKTFEDGVVKAERAEETRVGGDENAVDAELLRDGAGVEGAGAAESHEGVFGRVGAFAARGIRGELAWVEEILELRRIELSSYAGPFVIGAPEGGDLPLYYDTGF